jgi:hypothetical protein
LWRGFRFWRGFFFLLVYYDCWFRFFDFHHRFVGGGWLVARASGVLISVRLGAFLLHLRLVGRECAHLRVEVLGDELGNGSGFGRRFRCLRCCADWPLGEAFLDLGDFILPEGVELILDLAQAQVLAKLDEFLVV